MPLEKQAQTVLFIASLPDLRVPVHLGPAIAESTQLAHRHIAIVLVSHWFNGSQPLSRRKPGAVPSGLSHAGNWETVQKILTFAYVQATAAAHAEGHILLDVDVILQGTDMAIDSTLLSNAEVLTLLEGGTLSLRYDHTPGADFAPQMNCRYNMHSRSTRSTLSSSRKSRSTPMFQNPTSPTLRRHSSL